MQPIIEISPTPPTSSGVVTTSHNKAQTQATGIAMGGLTPQQLATAYGIDQIDFGAVKGDGSGQTIAIVDAYDDPDLVDSTSAGFKTSDLALFDQSEGLPDPPSFVKLSQNGTTNLPSPDSTPASGK